MTAKHAKLEVQHLVRLDLASSSHALPEPTAGGHPLVAPRGHKEAMMSRLWVRLTKAGKNYCIAADIPLCLSASLYAAPDPSVDPYIRAATEEINRILFRLNEEHAGPDRALAFLVVSDSAGDDILRLDWIYQDEEIITKSEGKGNY